MNRAHLLRETEYLRKTGGTRDASWGRWALSFPTRLDYEAACALFPGMKSQDAQEKTKATMEYIKSPLSEPYRVRDKI